MSGKFKCPVCGRKLSIASDGESGYCDICGEGYEVTPDGTVIGYLWQDVYGSKGSDPDDAWPDEFWDSVD